MITFCFQPNSDYAHEPEGKIAHRSLYTVIDIVYNRITKDKGGNKDVNGKKYC